MEAEFMRKRPKTPKTKTQKRELIKRNIPLLMMATPAVILMIMFNYIPMFGTVLAFKNYSVRKGIWGSDWAGEFGLDNFKYIFRSGEIAVTIRNTILYHLAFTITVMASGILLGILLYWVKSKRLARFYQETIQLPYLTSFAVMGCVVYILLKADGGLLNTFIEQTGGNAIAWYTEPKYWPLIIILVNLWFGAGIKSIYFYSAFLSIDKSLFEAGDMDGARWYHKIFNIMLPSIAPTICILLITDLGQIMSANFSLFYSLTMDSSSLYSVTDVISTYEYRGLTMGNFGTTAALGLFTSIVTVICTLSINKVVKKINPDNALI